MIALQEMHDYLDAHHLGDGLWQGSYPEGEKLREAGFDVVVLCAMEHQPHAERFPGVEVIYAPNDDTEFRLPTADEMRIATETAQRVADALKAGKKVLVTCWAGINRSGLVSALALHKLHGISGSAATTIVQTLRPGALSNKHFRAHLARVSEETKTK